MTIQTMTVPTVNGQPLANDEHPLGELRATSPDTPAERLRELMAKDGYVYLPGFFQRDQILEVRRELMTQLAEFGLIAKDSDPMDGICAPEEERRWLNAEQRKSAVSHPAAQEVLYGERTMSFFSDFLGGPARHYDFTWIRTTPPGGGTTAHTDLVFMGRGTDQVFTMWVPYGDIPLVLGGLAVLEGAHHHEQVHEYARHDVDTYCENLDQQPTQGPDMDMSLLDGDPLNLKQRVGGRWLTTSYEAGDVIIFSMFTPHVGIDNASGDRLRLSSDSRYQLASLEVDERWVGEDPIGHGPNAKVGLIC